MANHDQIHSIDPRPRIIYRASVCMNIVSQFYLGRSQKPRGAEPIGVDNKHAKAKNNDKTTL